MRAPMNATDDDPREPRGTAAELRKAAVTVGILIAFSLASVAVAAASSDALRTLLVIIAPIIVFLGALGVLRHTYRVWRARGRWQVWQGASWFLLAFFVIMLMNTAPILLE